MGVTLILELTFLPSSRFEIDMLYLLPVFWFAVSGSEPDRPGRRFAGGIRSVGAIPARSYRDLLPKEQQSSDGSA